MLRATLLMSVLAAPVWAEGLCDADPAEVLAQLSGAWQRDGALSIVNEVTDQLHRSGRFLARFEGGAISSPFLDSITGAPLPLSAVAAYDVDRVDDVLETTGRADIADTLSETLCGPEALPQFQAQLEVAAEISVTGTVTVIAYFDDALLQVTELELTSEDTLLFMTETVLLTPAPSGE